MRQDFRAHPRRARHDILVAQFAELMHTQQPVEPSIFELLDFLAARFNIADHQRIDILDGLVDLLVAHMLAHKLTLDQRAGGGADYVFECIGLVATAEQAVQMTSRGGTTVLVGVVPVTQNISINAADITLGEKKITGSLMGSNRFQYDMPRYVDFYMDGRLHLDEMISARIPLEQVNNAMDALRKGEAARQVIVFD